MHRRGPLVVKAGLALFSVILAMVLVDAACRLTGVGAPRRGVITPRSEPHRLVAWIDVFPPGFTGRLSGREFSVDLRMNSLGLRERELDFETLSTQRPCVLMGDSFFFGWGVEVEQRLSERLGGLLAGEGTPVPVVNFSFPGWCTFHYLEMWKAYVTRLKPRLVVLGCFVGNDFSDDLKQAHRLEGGGTTNDGVESDPVPAAKVGRFYRLGRSVRDLAATSPVIGAVQHLLWKSPGFRQAFNRMEMRDDRLVLYENEGSELQRRMYANTKAAYGEVARLANESGIRVVVLLIPDHLQVLSPELFHGLDAGRPQTEVKAHLDRLGIECLDLLPVFRSEANPARYYFREDKHWGVEGHDFVARALLPVVRRRVVTDPERASQPSPARVIGTP